MRAPCDGPGWDGPGCSSKPNGLKPLLFGFGICTEAATAAAAVTGSGAGGSGGCMGLASAASSCGITRLSASYK